MLQIMIVGYDVYYYLYALILLPIIKFGRIIISRCQVVYTDSHRFV